MIARKRCPCCNGDARIGPQFWTWKGPAAALRRLKGKPRAWCSPALWFDHVYTVRRDGAVIYVVEPYQLRAEDFGDIALLVSAGWRIVARAGAALHVPGQTISIEMTPPPRASGQTSRSNRRAQTRAKLGATGLCCDSPIAGARPCLEKCLKTARREEK